MAVTLQEIADRCQVSRVTVSEVLRNPDHPRYAKTTREKVLQAASHLKYSPNLVARSLRRGKTNLLGVIIPFNDPGMIDRIEYIAQELGYAVMVQFSPAPDEEAEGRALRAAIDRQVDGIIWQPCSTTSMSREKLAMVQASRIPIVQMQARIPQFTDADYVGIDWREAIRTGIRHLKACGYERIAYLTQPRGSYEPRRERVGMFEEISRSEGVGGDVLVADFQEIEPVVKRYLADHPRESLSFFGQGVQMAEVLETVRANGRRVPEDVGVLLFGDMVLGGKPYQLSDLLPVKLSVIRMPEMVPTAMSTLVDRIKKRRVGPGQAQILDVSLVQKASTILIER